MELDYLHFLNVGNAAEVQPQDTSTVAKVFLQVINAQFTGTKCVTSTVAGVTDYGVYDLFMLPRCC